MDDWKYVGRPVDAAGWQRFTRDSRGSRKEKERKDGRTGGSGKERAVGVTGSRFVNGHCIRAHSGPDNAPRTTLQPPVAVGDAFEGVNGARNAVKAVKGRPLPAGRTVGPPRTFLPSSLELKRNVDASVAIHRRAPMNNERRCTYALHLSRFPGTARLPPSLPPSLAHSRRLVLASFFILVCQRAPPAPREFRSRSSRRDRSALSRDPRGTFRAERPSPPPSFSRERENREKLAENLEITCFPSCDSSNANQKPNQIGGLPFTRVHRVTTIRHTKGNDEPLQVIRGCEPATWRHNFDCNANRFTFRGTRARAHVLTLELTLFSRQRERKLSFPPPPPSSFLLAPASWQPRKIAIWRDRARTLSCPRRVTEAEPNGGRMAGPVKEAQVAIHLSRQISRNAQAISVRDPQSASGGADSRTMQRSGSLSCARITRIRGDECLSITGCCRHVSISIHPHRAGGSSRHARVGDS